jgi:Zn finger protein HypA/HybF involved in hydrogenase expression
MIEKIHQIQMNAGRFNFIHMKHLELFCDIASKDKTIEDEYFKISTDWVTEAEHRIVSKNLSNFILKTIDC